MKKYRTSEVAKMMGIHPNTVRFYEKWGLITKPVREKNGYRVFTDLHICQIQIARLGFEIEILQNGLRKKIVQDILHGEVHESQLSLKRKEVSEYLDISVDVLRNWEMNGLIAVKRMKNGYRVYTDADIRQLKIIRVLRCANYCLEAIRRMMRQLSKNPESDIREILDTPREDDDIITACDRLLLSLSKAKINAENIMTILKKMKE